MGEETRKVLNKSIDLLHKLSKGKITRKEARQELSALLAGHFLTSCTNNEGVDINQKVKLQCYLDEALEIVDKIDSGQAPLYEGILLMNKVIVKRQGIKEETLPLDEKTITPIFDEAKYIPPLPKEELIKEVKVESSPKITKVVAPTYSQMGIQELMQEVLRNKELLEKSVLHLNESLLQVGFELRTIETR